MWDLINRRSATMSEKEPADSGKSCLVGKKEDLIEAKRASVTVGDRVVVVIYHQGVFYAMDQHCYRKENETLCVCVFFTGRCASSSIFIFSPLFLKFSSTKISKTKEWFEGFTALLYCVYISLCLLLPVGFCGLAWTLWD